MTASVSEVKGQPSFISVAVTVFFTHLALCLLLWFSDDHGQLSPDANAALIVLLFPVYIVFSSPPAWPDPAMWSLLVICWAVGGIFWSVLIAGLVWFCRRMYAKVI